MAIHVDNRGLLDANDGDDYVSSSETITGIKTVAAFAKGTGSFDGAVVDIEISTYAIASNWFPFKSGIRGDIAFNVDLEAAIHLRTRVRNMTNDTRVTVTTSGGN